jgi:citrate lyase subunit beta / citryl-CoA lyase
MARKGGTHRFRSVLFTPGNSSRHLKKSFGLGADVVVLDLEDAVAVGEKIAARAVVVEALSMPRECAAYVRVNSPRTDWCFGDLLSVVGPEIEGIVLPKVESAAQLHALDWFLTQLERERELRHGAVDLLPLIETATGIQQLEAICRASFRVRRLAFGGVDYSLDLNLRVGADETQLAYARARLTHCSREAGLEPPIDTVSTEVRDPEAFRPSAQHARRLGFQGKLCIHPTQVQAANEVFRPTDAEVRRAQSIVDAFSAAEQSGRAAIEVDGMFVDYPVVEQARRILAAAWADDAGSHR